MKPIVEELERRDCPTVSYTPWMNYAVYAGGPGDAPLVQIYNNKGLLLCQFFAFPPSYKGGLQLGAAGDNLVVGGGIDIKTYDQGLNLVMEQYGDVSTIASNLQAKVTELASINAFLLQNGITNYGVTDITALNQIVSEFPLVPSAVWAKLRAAGVPVALVPGAVTNYPPFAYLAGTPSANGVDYSQTLGATQAVAPFAAVIVPTDLPSMIFVYEIGHAVDFALGPLGISKMQPPIANYPATNFSSQPAWQSIWASTNWVALYPENNGSLYASSAAEAWSISWFNYLSGIPQPANITSYFQNVIQLLSS